MRRRVLSLAAATAAVMMVVSGPFPAAARYESGPASGTVAAPADSVPYTPLDYTPAAPNPAVPSGFDQVSETPSLRLYINRGDSKLIVEDKRNGKLWTSNPLTPLSDQKSLLDDALFLLNYTNARRQMTNLASSASEKPDLSFQNIPNGVRVGYDIQKLKLKISIDYALKEEPKPEGNGTTPYLEVTVPNDGITETGDCTIATSTTCFMITSLELLPLFGAAPVGAQGYVVIPDGAGSIVNFKPEYPQYRQRYSSQIYGPDAASNLFTGGRGGGNTLRTSIRMPLWGLKVEDSAYAGVVTKGEFQANINAYLAGYITAANRASTEFIYRRQASIPRRRTLFVNRIEDTKLPGDRQLRYVILNGDDANYAGVAKTFRDYLMKDKGIKRIDKQPPRPMIEFFHGITRRGAFKEDFVPMTRFDEGIEMIKAFMDKGLKDFDLNLIGWADDGYRGRWPRRYPAESGIGGNDALKRLIDYAHKNGIRVYGEDDYLFAYTFSSGGIFGQIPYVRNIWPNWSYGFNTRYDTIRGVNKLPVFSGAGGGDIFLLNPVISFQRYVQRDISKHKELGWDGVTVRSMGSIVSSDTNDRYPLSREETAQQFMKIADFEKAQLGHVMVDGPNVYTVGHTERVYSAPEQSLDAFGDTPVPLYHIALNGLVTRTQGSFYAVNMRNDPKTEFLRQIEYDIQPTYLLTHQPSADLIRTQANWLFTSQYEEWVDPAVKEYRQMRDEFGYLNGLFVTNHEMLDYQVYRVTYEDGSQLTVNYNPTPFSGNGLNVAGYGYTLKKGAGR